MVFNNLDDVKVGSTSIAKVYRGSSLIWQAGTPPTPTEPDWLTMTILSGGTIYLNHDGNIARYAEIEYKINNDVWKTISSGAFRNYFNVETGDIVKLRAIGNYTDEGFQDYSIYYGLIGTTGDYSNNFSGSTAVFDISGSLLSMEYGSGFTGQTESTIPGHGYRALFTGTKVHSAENMMLPLSGTGTANFMSLFENCEFLITAPTISDAAFRMGCGSMFRGCSSLNYVKCLAEGGPNYSIYWLAGVAATGTFVKDTNATWASGGNGIPDNWTIINV